MLAGAFSKHRLQDMAGAEAARKKRKDEIRVYHARMQIQGEEEDEKEVVNMRLKKKEKVWRKNYKII